jgi:hypothetical protein
VAAARELAGMRIGLLLLIITFPTSLCSQMAKSTRWTTVEKICGAVALTEVANTTWSYHSSTKPLGHGVVVFLYHRDGKKRCCTTEQLVARKETEDGGRFEFAETTPGDYWVVVLVGKKLRKLAVTLKTLTDTSVSACSDFVYEVKDGDLNLKRAYRM